MATSINTSQLVLFENGESIYFNKIPINSYLFDIVSKFLEEKKNFSEVCHLGEDKIFLRNLLNYYRYGNISYQRKLHEDMNWLVFCKRFDIPPITFSSKIELCESLCSMYHIKPDDYGCKPTNFSLHVINDGKIAIDVFFEDKRKIIQSKHKVEVICRGDEDEDKDNCLDHMIPYNHKIHYHIWKPKIFYDEVDNLKWYSFVNFYLKDG